jgi:hypothetical protein
MANRGGGPTAVWGFAYDLHVTGRVTVEGALDIFYYDTPTTGLGSVYRDDFAGAEVAVLIHPLNCCDTGRLLPFVAVGIGKTTTDFTEIAANRYYRFGVGAAYQLDLRFGVRLELRDDYITRLYGGGSPAAHLPSVRASFVRRF